MYKRFGAVMLAAMGWMTHGSAVLSEDAASPEPRARVVSEDRLHRLLQSELAAGVKLAEARRGFAIRVQSVDGIDDWEPPKVRSAISQWLASNSELEGILFVGNIKLPSFFMPRPDLPE